MFLFPTLVTLYFSFDFILKQINTLNHIEIRLYASKDMLSITKFIHNIQIERGLSAGYLGANDPRYIKENLNSIYKKTDKSFEDFKGKFLSNNSLRKKLNEYVVQKNINTAKKILNLMAKINIMRKQILNKQISFNEEIEYYTQINGYLLDIMYIYISYFDTSRGEAIDIYLLEKLKENAGLERAYVYNLLLAKDFKNIEKIRNIITEEKKSVKEFLLATTFANAELFQKIIDYENLRDIKFYREKIFNEKINDLDARKWFEISSKYINELEKVTIDIVHKKTNLFMEKLNEEKKKLYYTILFWILSIISLGVIFYYLVRLINKEQQVLDDLRIAAYTFESQEAVTITDKYANILKVNKAFSRITGYSEKEVIGKTPNILKSGKHPDGFYTQMWHTLLEEGKWSGEIYNKRKNGEIYPEKLSITAIKDEKGDITHYIAQFTDVSELKKAEEEAIYQARHDFLTGLPNRASMIERLNEEFYRAKRHDFYNAFLFLDLDGFKKINDTYGHHIGDKVLIEVANRLKSTIRTDDYIARISGDEFCILLLELGKDEEDVSKKVKTVCDNIINIFSTPMIINTMEIKVGISIGIRLFPNGVKNINEIINGSDSAMYKAKEYGKNQYVFFNNEIEHKIKEITKLEKELKEAFEQNQFEFYFQPKVSVETQDIVGAEILLRWNHPTKGLLEPNSFMSVIKDMRRESEITFMALKKGCEFILKYSDKLDKTVSINVSSLELISKSFVDKVLDVISSYNLYKCENIEFEILESDLIADFENIIKNIMILKQNGIKISIDDFGTGYSSISYLSKLPIDTIKVDKYFMQNIDDSANKRLIKMMLEIAESFYFDIVIEGVETKEQLDFIKQNKAKIYQGFYFSKALKQEKFEKLLNS
jgi:diguanylate cyclase (GGDEF)-like protein/PAS domain S-box-containing protein